jgi:hypothetical protein
VTETNEIFNRLGQLEEDSTEARTRLTHVEATLATHSSKLDRIIDALSARRDFNPLMTLQFIKDAAILLGLVAGFIIYMAGNIGSREDAVLQYRVSEQASEVDRLNQELAQLRMQSWKAAIEK